MSDSKSLFDAQWAIYKDRILKLIKNHRADLRNTTGALPIESVPMLPGTKIDDGAITPAKLSFDPATQAELDAEAVTRASADTALQAPSYLTLALSGTLANERRVVAGANITLTDGGANGDLAIAASGGAGTVTSVALTAPAELAVAGTPITVSGTLALTWAQQAANRLFAGPASGANATPAFRALVALDIPSLTAAKISDFDTQVRLSRLDQLAAPTADLSINSHKLTNVTDPTAAQDAATKAYVDAVAQGLSVKGSAKWATDGALPANTYSAGVLTANATGVLLIDGGSTVALGDRVLVKDEASGLKNGLYVCTTAGAVGVAYVLTRTSDMDVASEIPGAFVFVETGAVNNGAGFVVAGSGPYTLGTSAIVWTQFSGAGEITVGAGLSKSGNTLSLIIPVAVANGGNGVTARPAFSVHKDGATQTGIVSGVLTKVTWPTEVFDTNGNFASDKFTPTVAGKYLFLCPIMWVNTTGDQVELMTALYKNGAFEKSARILTSGANQFQAAMLVVTADANGSTDYFEIYARHQDAANRSIYAGIVDTWWNGLWVGPQ